MAGSPSRRIATRLLRNCFINVRIIFATGSVFSPPAIERLSSGVFEEVIVTNTITASQEGSFPALTVLSVANLLGEAIWRVFNATSVQSIRDQ